MSKIAAFLMGTFFLISQNASAMPAEIIIIRHGEKPKEGKELNERGWERARELVPFFQNDSRVTRFGQPVAIYAMRPGSDRPVETVTPLAQQLGLTIIQKFKKEEVQGLVDEIRHTPDFDGKMVLICWEHDVILDIVRELGIGSPPAPSEWPGGVFNWAFIVDFVKNETPKFQQINQNLPIDKDTIVRDGM